MVFSQYGLQYEDNFRRFSEIKRQRPKNNFLPENLSIRWYLLWIDVKIIEFRQIFLTVVFSDFDLFSPSKINYSSILHIFLFSLVNKKKFLPITPPEKGDVCT
jgi:hypothetical protein